MAAAVSSSTPAGSRTRTSVTLAFLIVWGLAVGTFGAMHLSHQVPQELRLMSGRATSYSNEVRVLQEGGPALLGIGTNAVTKSVHADFSHPAAYFLAGVGDDQGSYLYLPLIGDVTNTTSAVTLLRWFFIGAMVLLLVMYPIVFYGLFDSVIVAALAPVVLLWKFRFMQDTDIYWILGWAILFGLPLVLLALRRWRSWSPLVLALAVLGASFASSIRSHAGLPIVIAAVVVALVRAETWPRKITLVAALLVINLSLSSFALEGIRTERDASIGQPGLSDKLIAVHPFWHPTYLGLGWLDNKYGIRWSDPIAAAAVYKVDPNAGYLTPRYEAILRHQWFHILKTNPGFVARVMWSKVVTLVGDALEAFWLGAIFAIGMLLVARRRREYAVWLALLVPGLLVLAAPMILAVPIPPYDVGWLAGWGFAFLLGVLWLAEELIHAVRRVYVGARDGTAPDALTYARSLSAGRVARALLVVLLVLVVAEGKHTLPIQAAQATANFSHLPGAPPIAAVRKTRVVAGWTFAPGPPKGWLVDGGTAAGNANGLILTTTTSPSTYQLSGPKVLLPPGRYVLAVDGKVDSGGMQPGVLNSTKDAWVKQAAFWSGQWWMGSKTHEIGFDFAIDKPTSIQPIIANWAPDSSSSRWTIRHVTIERRGA